MELIRSITSTTCPRGSFITSVFQKEYVKYHTAPHTHCTIGCPAPIKYLKLCTKGMIPKVFYKSLTSLLTIHIYQPDKQQRAVSANIRHLVDANVQITTYFTLPPSMFNKKPHDYTAGTLMLCLPCTFAGVRDVLKIYKGALCTALERRVILFMPASSVYWLQKTMDNVSNYALNYILYVSIHHDGSLYTTSNDDISADYALCISEHSRHHSCQLTNCQLQYIQKLVPPNNVIIPANRDTMLRTVHQHEAHLNCILGHLHRAELLPDVKHTLNTCNTCNKTLTSCQFCHSCITGKASSMYAWTRQQGRTCIQHAWCAVQQCEIRVQIYQETLRSEESIRAYPTQKFTNPLQLRCEVLRISAGRSETYNNKWLSQHTRHWPALIPQYRPVVIISCSSLVGAVSILQEWIQVVCLRYYHSVIRGAVPIRSRIQQDLIRVFIQQPIICIQMSEPVPQISTIQQLIQLLPRIQSYWVQTMTRQLTRDMKITTHLCAQVEV